MSPADPPKAAATASAVKPSLFARLFKAFGFTMTAGAVVAGVGGAIYLRTDDFQRRVLPLIDQMIEEATGEKFDVDRLDVHAWPPSVEMKGARLWHEATGDTIVGASRIKAPVVLRDGAPKLGRLVIEDPLVDLHIDKEGGLREFKNAKKGGGGSPMRELPWSSLELSGGTIRLSFPDGRLLVSDLGITPTQGRQVDVHGNLLIWYRDLEDRAGIDWKDVQLGPDRIVLPALQLDTGLVRLEGSANVPLQGDLDLSLQVHGALEGANVLFEAPRAIQGMLDADIQVTGSPKDPTVALAVHVDSLNLDNRGANTPVLHYRFGEVSVLARATKQGIDIERTLVRAGDGTIEVSGHITPDLELVGATVLAEHLSLEHLLKSLDAAPTPWVDFRGDLEGRLSGTLKPLKISGPVKLVVSDFTVGNGPISNPDTKHMIEIPTGRVNGSITIEPDHLSIHSRDVHTKRNSGGADVTIGFGPRGPLDIDFELTKADLEDFQPLNDVGLKGRGYVKGRVHGPFNKLTLEGVGDLKDFEVVGVPYADHLVADISSPDMNTLVLTNANATIGQTRYNGDFKMDFRGDVSMDTSIEITEGRVEDLVGMFVDIEGLTGDLTGTLELHGPLFDMDGEAHVKVANAEVYGATFESGSGHGYMNKGLFTLDDLRLLRENGTAGLILRGSVKRAYALNMELIADGFRLETLDHLRGLDLPLSGRASVVARIDNTLSEPAPHGRIMVTDVRYSGQWVGDSAVQVVTENGIARFQGKVAGSSIATVGTLGLWGDQPYSVFASLIDFPLSVVYPTAADGQPVGGALTGKINLDGQFGPNPTPPRIEADISGIEITWDRHVLKNSAPWHYEQTGSKVVLENLSLEGGLTNFTLERLVRDEDGLRMLGGGRVDVNLLQALVPDLTRAEGYADILLTAEGQGKHISTRIAAQVSANLLRHASFPEAFEDVEAVVRASEDGYEILSLRAGVGGGSVIGKGIIDAQGFVPTRWNLQAEATDTQVQWTKALPPAIGDASLRFDGPVDALLLSGEFIIREMDFVDRINWEDWVVSYSAWSNVGSAPVESDPYFSLDIHITADDTVTLRNNVAEGRASADLTIIGDTSRPGMTGRVLIDNTDVFLQDRDFTVDRGIVTYIDPWSWDPNLDFELVTDITSNDTRYRIYYLIRGPLSNWTSETRSEPALAQADINALLWFGLTTDDLEGMGELSSAVATGVADMLLTDLFITRGGGVRDDLGNIVDRIEIATGVDARGEYNPDPRLVVEKRIDAWDATARVDINTLKWDDWQAKADFRIDDSWSLALWYARVQRDRVLTIGGAYGIDLRARWEVK